MEIDQERCLRAMQNLNVSGYPRPGRIEEAIAAIQSDPQCLRVRYIGVKNYAAFGDQDCDCEYGCGPRHGHIVFRIARTDPRNDKPQPRLGADEIYLLECVRDFGAWTEPHPTDRNRTHERNLCDTLRLLKEARDRAAELTHRLTATTVLVHD